MRERLCGLENEITPVYSRGGGLYMGGESGELVRKFIVFIEERVGKSRSSSRAVLPNQGQVYVDQGHFEYCTPECGSASDLVLHQRVCRRIITELLVEFNQREAETSAGELSTLHFFESATHVFRTSSCGCHENYQILGSFSPGSLDERSADSLRVVTFLIARKILEGSGSFCADKNVYAPGRSADLRFFISQRLKFIEAIDDGATTTNRPFIYFKRESLSGGGARMATRVDFTRLHVLSGEHNNSPFCNFIKIGSVSLLYEMMEEGYFKDKGDFYFLGLDKNYLRAINDAVDCDLSCRKRYEFSDGSKLSLAEILEVYASWMLDYLDKFYDRSERKGLYWEKVDIANKIIDAAIGIKKEGIFYLQRKVDWVIKLRWMQDFLKDEAKIEIGDDEIESWVYLSETLEKRWGQKELRNGISRFELEEKILMRHAMWHFFERELSSYQLLEDVGFIEPLCVAGREIDYEKEVPLNLNKVPMNPPNRSLIRKKFFDFMKRLKLAHLTGIYWERCVITGVVSADRKVLERRFSARRDFLNAVFPSSDKAFYLFVLNGAEISEEMKDFFRSVKDLTTACLEEEIKLI